MILTKNRLAAELSYRFSRLMRGMIGGGTSKQCLTSATEADSGFGWMVNLREALLAEGERYLEPE